MAEKRVPEAREMAEISARKQSRCWFAGGVGETGRMLW